MRIKETISANEVGALEDVLPEFRQTKKEKSDEKHEGSEGEKEANSEK